MACGCKSGAARRPAASKAHANRESTVRVTWTRTALAARRWTIATTGRVDGPGRRLDGERVTFRRRSSVSPRHRSTGTCRCARRRRLGAGLGGYSVPLGDRARLVEPRDRLRPRAGVVPLPRCSGTSTRAWSACRCPVEIAVGVRVHEERREVGRSRRVRVVGQAGRAAVALQRRERVVRRRRRVGGAENSALLEVLRRQVRARVVDALQQPVDRPPGRHRWWCRRPCPRTSCRRRWRREAFTSARR